MQKIMCFLVTRVSNYRGAYWVKLSDVSNRFVEYNIGVTGEHETKAKTKTKAVVLAM